MASTHKHIRSSTADKRPTTAIADGQLAINTNAASAGLFFKDSTGATIIKVGPVHVGSTAPNATPAVGGSSGNSTGEVWLDNSLTPVGVKIWDGSAWVNATPAGSTTVQGLLELATNAETQAGSDTARAVTPAGLQSKVSDSTSTTSSTTIASSTAVKAAYDLANAALPKTGGTITGNLEIGTAGSLTFEGATADAFETTLAVVDPTADRTITLPDRTGTVITNADTGTVTSTMIADGTIVNADINASAAIALSKLATGALPSAITVSSTNIVDGTIVNADVNASAAIAGTKISPDFGGQNVVTTGSITGASLIPSSATVPTNGVYLPAANSVGISTNGNGRLFVDSSGNVGVGASSPAVKCHIEAGNTSEILRITRTIAGEQAGIGFVGVGTTNRPLIGCRSNDFVFDLGGSERLRITSDGKVGLGTSSPQQILHTRGASDTGFVGPRIQNNNGLTGLAGVEFSSDPTYAKAAIAHVRNSVNGRGDLVFYNDASNDAAGWATGDEKVRITYDGKVGVGTTSPNELLQISGTNDTAFGLKLSSGTQAFTCKFDTSGNTNINNNLARALIFSTSNAERARIDSSGRLLVGTSSAITGSASVTDGTQFINTGTTIGAFANNAFSYRLLFAKSRNATPGSHTIVQNGDALGYVDWSGSDGTNFILGARITAEVDGTPGANDMPGRLVFSTTADGASSPTERMRINNGGSITLGGGAPATNSTVTVYPNNYAGTAMLDWNRASTATVANALRFQNGGNPVGSITYSNTATAYNTSSDYRLKENVTAVTDGITRLQQLKPSRFNFIADPAKTVDGFLAHEVQDIVPEAITGEKDAVDADGNPEYQGIDQSKLVPLLTAALQEAIAKIESLEARLTAAGI